MSDVTISVIDRDGDAHQLNTEPGQVLMHVVRDNIDLETGICGGEISCGTCLVRLNPEWASTLPAPGTDEAEMLDALGAGTDARLSCQVILDRAADGMQATILQEA